MSKATEDLIGVSIASLIVVVALGIGLFTAHWVFKGFNNWRHSITYTSPQEKAEKAKESRDAEQAWANNPTNPANIAKHCMKLGGTPIISAWDGHVKKCEGSEGKNVNIEVNQ